MVQPLRWYGINRSRDFYGRYATLYIAGNPLDGISVRYYFVSYPDQDYFLVFDKAFYQSAAGRFFVCGINRKLITVKDQ